MTTGSWGGSTWGGLTVTISLESAAALGQRLVDVWLTGVPAASDPYAIGDALNPLIWSISRADTGEVLTVAGVTRVSAQRYRLQTIETLGPVSVTHTVSTETLRAVSGTLCIPPRSATFAGIESLDTPLAIADRPIDLATAGVVSGSAILGGSMVVGDDGDYTTHSGDELLRKLIIRRLITRRGAFTHLPEYGLGLPVKMPLRSSMLATLKTQIEQECLKEQDVAAASASLTVQPDGYLLIVLKVRRKVGNTVEYRFATAPGGVQVS